MVGVIANRFQRGDNSLKQEFLRILLEGRLICVLHMAGDLGNLTGRRVDLDTALLPKTCLRHQLGEGLAGAAARTDTKDDSVERRLKTCPRSEPAHFLDNRLHAVEKGVIREQPRGGPRGFHEEQIVAWLHHSAGARHDVLHHVRHPAHRFRRFEALAQLENLTKRLSLGVVEAVPLLAKHRLVCELHLRDHGREGLGLVVIAKNRVKIPDRADEVGRAHAIQFGRPGELVGILVGGVSEIEALEAGQRILVLGCCLQRCPQCAQHDETSAAQRCTCQAEELDLAEGLFEPHGAGIGLGEIARDQTQD